MHKVTADYLHKNQNLLLLINLDFFLSANPASCFMFLVSFWKIKEVISDALEPSLSAASWTLGHTTSATTSEKILCSTCITYQSPNCKLPLSGGPPFLKSPEGHSLTLSYAAEDEDIIVKEIVAMGSSSSISGRPPLTVAFLLCMCVQYSSVCLQTSDLRRLLLRIASGVQSAMWVSCSNRHKELCHILKWSITTTSKKSCFRCVQCQEIRDFMFKKGCAQVNI